MESRFNYGIMRVLLIMSLLASCGDKSTSDPVNEDSKNVKVGQIQTTSFTATVSSTFKGLSKVDIALGKYGILYCVKSDQSESILNSWKEGNDNAECLMYTNKNALDGESFSGTVGGLYPGTEYSFCLFTQNSDNSVREISDIHTFKTLGFSPSIKAINLKDIHYIDATAELEFGMDALDAACCEYGVMLSESSGVDVSTASLIERYTEGYDSRISHTISGIKPDKSYYCRPYVKYAIADDRYDYLYGPESTFATMTSDQMYVDLGLPSGIKWANCDLGQHEFVYAFDGPWYQWGSTEAIIRADRAEWYYSHYEYWDEQNRTFIDIGQEISGTVYDAASHILGGKWRMPTKTDLEELIANCNVSAMDNEKHTIYIYGSTRQVNPVVGHVVGNNRNEIIFNAGPQYVYWCSTLGEDDNPYSFIYTGDIESGRLIPNTGRFEINTNSRVQYHSIRPVWDPNMPD